MLEIPRTEGMTDDEKNAAWNAYFAEQRKDAERILRPIREEAGYPLDPSDPDAWFGVDREVVHTYIEALENTVVAERRVAELVRARRL